MAPTLGTIRGTIEIDYDGAGVIRAKKDMADVEKRGVTTQQAADKTSRTFGLMGAAIVGGFALAAKSAADFDKQMSAVAAVSGASGDQLDALRKKALQLGKDTTFSASEAGQAMEELVKAGLSVDDVLNGAADATVALAAAGGVDLPQAAAIASNAMNQFNLSAKDLPRVADLIAGAANASAIDVHDFGMSLSQVGAVANLAGQSFEDTATAIALMGNAGIKGSDAGTSLKTMLSNLIPTTDKQKKLFQELGLAVGKSNNAFINADGSYKNLGEIAGILHDRLSGLSEAQRQQALETIFGSDAIRAAAILTNEGADGFANLNKEMNKTTAADVAAKRLDNTAGKLEQLKGSAETLGIIIGSALIPAINSIIVKVTDLLNWFINLDDTWRNVILIFAGSVGTLLLVTAGIIKLVKAIETIAATIRIIKAWTITTKLAAAATKAWAVAQRLLSAAFISSPIGIIVLAIIALVAAFILAWKHSETFRKIVIGVLNALKDAALAVVGWFTGPFVNFWKAVWDGIVIGAKAVAAFFVGFWNGLVAVAKAFAAPFIAVWNTFYPAIKAVFDLIVAIAQLFWSIITALFTVAITILKAIFIPMWNLFVTTVKVAFGLIQAIITAAWNFIRPYIEGALKALLAAWNAVWGAISTATSAVWNAIKAVIKATIDFIKPYVTAAINVISSIIRTTWGAISSTTSTTWNGVKAVFNAVWNFITSLVRAAVNSVVSIMNGLKRMVDSVKAWFNGLKTAAQGGVGSLLAYVGTIPKAILDKLGDLGKLLYNSGKKIIQGLIDGIKSMLGPVKDAVGSVLGAARDLLPFSPAKEGPFSGKGWTTYSGASMMEGLAEGIAQAREMPVDALMGALGTVAVHVPDAVSSGASGGSARPLPVSDRTVTIGQLNIRGVWDFTNPGATRQMVGVLHQELDRYEKEHV